MSNSLPDSIYLTSGNDTFPFSIPKIGNRRSTAGAGDDQFLAEINFMDFADGGAGNDTFSLGTDGGFGTIVGGSGNDTIDDNSGHQTADNWDLGSGTDTWNVTPDDELNGGATYAQTLPPNLERFTLSEINAPVKVTGNGLDNAITLKCTVPAGATVNGGGGNDYIEVDNTNNPFTQSTGVANIEGSAGNDTLVGKRC